MKVTFTNIEVTIDARDANEAYAILSGAMSQMYTEAASKAAGIIEWSSGNYQVEDGEVRDSGELTF